MHLDPRSHAHILPDQGRVGRVPDRQLWTPTEERVSRCLRWDERDGGDHILRPRPLQCIAIEDPASQRRVLYRARHHKSKHRTLIIRVAAVLDKTNPTRTRCVWFTTEHRPGILTHAATSCPDPHDTHVNRVGVVPRPP